ncbi:MAG: MFS transporter [Gammaproteobacteria bacterium]|nr:MFS transporter [Gammaproteobacteria bacterium]MDH3578110.1 MFS transporter [Gammaproteobacteria bacterium]
MEQAKNKNLTGWYAVGIMTVAYMFSYIDRQIISLMVGPIREDLGISDSGFSLLVGLAFALFYTVLGIPIGRLADASNRRNIIAIGIAFWSLATAACGLARTFGQLFVARVAVGVGEAALSPAAYSMLADMFSPKKLGRAIGIYSSGVFIGIGLSFIVGAYLVTALEANGGLSLPLFGHLKPWQATFVIVGAPGLIVALLMLTVPEPVRARSTVTSMPVRQVLGFAVRHYKVYALHFVGFAMITLVFNGIMAWAAEYFIRIHEIPRADIGPKLGIIAAIFGGTGIICGGLFCDWLSNRGHTDAPIKAGLAGTVMLLPFAIAAPLVGNPSFSLMLFAPLLFFVSFPFGPAAAGLQMVTPPRMRAQMSAVYLFVVNLTGIGFGGTAVALITDFVFHDDMMLHWSMALVAAIGGVLAILLLALAQKPFRRTISELDHDTSASGD